MASADETPASYAGAGVDEEREQSAFARVMRPWLEQTAVDSPLVSGVAGLSSGYFATLITLAAGPPLALTTDGVGTKILLARSAGRYESIGVDVVANNVNDVVCVGAQPLALLDYLATDRIDEAVLGDLARGMYLGARRAGIAIPGGEIAQIGAMLAKPRDGAGPMLDVVGTAIGAMPARADGGWREPVDGSGVSAGDAIIGLTSSGPHSNGYSLARHALFENAGMRLADEVPGAGVTLAEALLEPTRIYVQAADALWRAGVPVRGLVHISGGGLLNLGRLAADVTYELDALPDPPAVFALIARAGGVTAATMYATFNMGIGMCVIVDPARCDDAMAVLRAAGESPVVIGRVREQPGKIVNIPSLHLTGSADTFVQR